MQQKQVEQKAASPQDKARTQQGSARLQDEVINNNNNNNNNSNNNK